MVRISSGIDVLNIINTQKPVLKRFWIKWVIQGEKNPGDVDIYLQNKSDQMSW